jgi:hypothetical protein
MLEGRRGRQGGFDRHTVESFVVQQAEDVWRFLVRIGDAIYQVVLHSVHAVVGAIEFPFQKIKVA